MSKADRAKKRQQRKRYAKPSMPRVIGANDNVEAANDNGLRATIDDRDKVALAIAKRRAAKKEQQESQDHYDRLIATGVEARIVGTTVMGKRVGGLEWLFRKERIDIRQYRAGNQYGDDFAKAEEPTLRSCLNDRVGGEPEPMQETKRAAAARLEAARVEALQNHEGLIQLMDAVCGYGARIRVLVNGDDAEATRKEAQLALGLEFLARHYGIV